MKIQKNYDNFPAIQGFTLLIVIHRTDVQCHKYLSIKGQAYFLICLLFTRLSMLGFNRHQEVTWGLSEATWLSPDFLHHWFHSLFSLSSFSRHFQEALSWWWLVLWRFQEESVDSKSKLITLKGTEEFSSCYIHLFLETIFLSFRIPSCYMSWVKPVTDTVQLNLIELGIYLVNYCYFFKLFPRIYCPTKEIV